MSPHPPHNHTFGRTPPPQSVTDRCPGCIAGRAVRAVEDHGHSDDPLVEIVISALASSGADWHGDHRCVGCGMTLRARLREFGYDDAVRATPREGGESR